MINFDSFTLENGLKVVVHQDNSFSTVVMNILYDVGSRDETEDKTGFAHLFEHLMFGGSINIADYDKRLQMAGGTNNAFTSPDITNYYLTLPAANIETGFWLESDRMLNLSFAPKTLEVQRKVVIEEFKQRYLNQPYGDIWLKMRPLAYKKHPYKWATIGKDISHIKNATMGDVKSFFAKFYNPSNAILVVAGNISLEKAKQLSQKWFAPIPSIPKPQRNLPKEPKQTTARNMEVNTSVASNALYKSYKMCEKSSDDFIASDLLSDILGQGKSSVLYQKLVVEKSIFTNISASILGSLDAGLFNISGYLNKDISFQIAEESIQEVISSFFIEKTKTDSLQNIKNKLEAYSVFSETELLPRAMNLAYATLLGNPQKVNTFTQEIQAVSSEKIDRVASQILQETNCSSIYYGNN